MTHHPQQYGDNHAESKISEFMPVGNGWKMAHLSVQMEPVENRRGRRETVINDYFYNFSVQVSGCVGVWG